MQTERWKQTEAGARNKKCTTSKQAVHEWTSVQGDDGHGEVVPVEIGSRGRTGG